jgi:hypothetical protein
MIQRILLVWQGVFVKLLVFLKRFYVNLHFVIVSHWNYYQEVNDLILLCIMASVIEMY